MKSATDFHNNEALSQRARSLCTLLAHGDLEAAYATLTQRDVLMRRSDNRLNGAPRLWLT